VDGHERFGRWNRPNQNGPEEMGWRVTAQNFNLNRDYMKADAPEMQSMLRLLDAWDPVLYVDLHVTDGAQFEPDTSNNLEPALTGDSSLQPLGRALIADLSKTLTSQGFIALDFYPSFRVADDPASGFDVSTYPPRFSTGYWALHNRFSLLVETHSWKDYPRRVKITHHTIVALADMMAKQGKQWRAATRDADRSFICRSATPWYRSSPCVHRAAVTSSRQRTRHGSASGCRFTAFASIASTRPRRQRTSKRSVRRR
jgi:hypothetical protein